MQMPMSCGVRFWISDYRRSGPGTVAKHQLQPSDGPAFCETEPLQVSLGRVGLGIGE